MSPYTDALPKKTAQIIMENNFLYNKQHNNKKCKYNTDYNVKHPD